VTLNQKLYGFLYCCVIQTHFDYSFIPVLKEITLRMATWVVKTCC